MPSVSPACIASDASSAAPAVRITQWVDSFGENGVLMSACGDNFGPAFDRAGASPEHGGAAMKQMADGVPPVPCRRRRWGRLQRPHAVVPTAARDGSIGGFGGADGGAFVPVRKADILVVVDDSAETRLMQDNLVRNFPTFMNRLMDPPGLPDLHVAVISTDMGAGDGSIAGCDATGGKNGIFQYQRARRLHLDRTRAGCNLHRRRRHEPNYTGPISDVFGCIAALGESGCGFEHQLAAITRALGADGSPPPAENQGFLRPDAFL